MLYIIQPEPLAEYLRKSQDIKGIKILDETNGTEKEIRVCQYVDDTIIFLENHNMTQKSLEIIDDFGLASGSKLNKEKTIGIVLNRKIKPNSEVKITNGPEKVLGIPIGKHVDFEDFWNKLLQKLKSKLDMWKNWTYQLKAKYIL